MGFGKAQYRVILVCGLCFMSDSIEIGLLSFLQIKAKEEFDLDATREALLTCASVSCVDAILQSMMFRTLDGVLLCTFMSLHCCGVEFVV